MKTITSLTDIKTLVKNKTEENHYLEFKSARIFSEEQNKEKILKEVVAFANSDGGQLIIGIEEDSNQAASEIAGIPDHSLNAQKIQQWCSSNLEPPLTSVTTKSISTEADKGVIIVSVRASQLAPHRLFKGQQSYNRNAYVRRNRDSQPMSMREIHDLVRIRDRGAADIESRFKGLQIEQEILKDGQFGGSAGYVLKILALQSQKMNCDVADFKPTFYLNDDYKILGSGFQEWLYDSSPKRRILRGITYQGQNRRMIIHQDGSIQLTENVFPQDNVGRLLTVGRILTLFTLSAINALKIAKNTGSEIYLSCSILHKHLNGIGVVGNYDKMYGANITRWKVSNFPIYRLNDFGGLAERTEEFMNDIFHEDGKEVPPYKNKIIFPETLE